MSKIFSESFKRDAVLLALTSRFTRFQVASELGLDLWVLNRWIREFEEGPLPDNGDARLVEEITMLRAENDALRAQISANRQPSLHLAQVN